MPKIVWGSMGRQAEYSAQLSNKVNVLATYSESFVGLGEKHNSLTSV